MRKEKRTPNRNLTNKNIWLTWKSMRKLSSKAYRAENRTSEPEKTT